MLPYDFCPIIFRIIRKLELKRENRANQKGLLQNLIVLQPLLCYNLTRQLMVELQNLIVLQPPFLINGGGRWIAQGCQISFKICCNLQFFCRK